MATTHLRDLHISGVSFDVYAHTGEVMGANRESVTEVSGSGGGGRYNPAVGTYQPDDIRISSTTTTYNQLFIRAADGSEKEITTTNQRLGVRNGSTVSILWGIKAGKERGPYLALYNHHTRRCDFFDDALREFFDHPRWRKSGVVLVAWVFFVPSCIVAGTSYPSVYDWFGILFWVLLLYSFFGLFVNVRISRRRKIRKFKELFSSTLQPMLDAK